MRHWSWLAYFAILSASLLAAAGQLLLSAGAAGSATLAQFFNARVVLGLLAYALGMLAWIFALSKLSLTIVYAFTALTFILVYLGSALVLHQALGFWPKIGVALVAGGFLIIAFCGQRPG